MDNITIARNKKQLNITLIHQFLTNSYLAKGRTIEQVTESIDHSICYGVYKNEQQIGFARVISDKVVFAYIMDVFIIDHERANGYAVQLLDEVLQDRDLDEVKQWYLKTKDAHQFYAKSGFKDLEHPEWFMGRLR